ncbi:MAG TPA: NAD(P)/FAD-dependent oxidoreductase [Acidimicrobiales bacterium]|nr:NAD(P)/FAD-dependent oxidoreductase [Acidimicrobiales bacterium]
MTPAGERPADRSEDADVIVVGAGTAGVTCTRALASGGARVIVLEAGERVGGRVWTVRDFVETPVEAGAEFVHGVGAATWADIRSAGLRVQGAPNRYSWFNLGGRTRWLPLHLAHPQLWRSFDILWALRRYRGPDTNAATFMDTRGYGARAGELVALALSAHLPAGVEEVGMAGLLADGVLHLEQGLNHRVIDGYDLLPRQIAIGLDVRFRCRVSEVSWSPGGVEVATDDGRSFRGRAAVCAVPHGVLADGRIAFVPDLPPAKSDAITRIKTGPVGKVLLHFDERFWPARMTQLVCGSGPVTLYWSTSYGTGGPPVLSAYATGPRARALSRSGPEEAVDIVLDDLARLFPRARPRASLRAARVVDWLTDPNALGGYTFLPPGALGARAALAAPDTGALFWAGSATAWAPVADTVEAAYLSGMRAARQAGAALQGTSPV